MSSSSVRLKSSGRFFRWRSGSHGSLVLVMAEIPVSLATMKSLKNFRKLLSCSAFIGKETHLAVGERMCKQFSNQNSTGLRMSPMPPRSRHSVRNSFLGARIEASRSTAFFFPTMLFVRTAPAAIWLFPVESVMRSYIFLSVALKYAKSHSSCTRSEYNTVP